MISTIYLTRNGLLEPLGQSQILPYLRGLSSKFRITVISFEKPRDLFDSDYVTSITRECEQLGINWLPQRFSSTPRFLAPLLSFFLMAWILFVQVRIQKARLLHARSYLPAFATLFVGYLTRVPYIFDMRALWLDELIMEGRLKEGSLLHSMMTYLERLCIRQAGAVISLTQAALIHLKNIYPDEMKNKCVVIIPTCADLVRFVPARERPKRMVVGCHGTVLSGWFQLNWLASFFAVVDKSVCNAYFEITTLDDPKRVSDAIGGSVSLQSRLSITRCASSMVHEVLRNQVVSVMFFKSGTGKLGSSPTRMAEALACGLPVVTNEGIGDIGDVIKKYRVGVLVSSPSESDMLDAWESLRALLLDPYVSLRCRRAAEELFSLDSGIAAYVSIYSNLVNDN